jgi:NAD(P)H-hydrate epimerase
MKTILSAQRMKECDTHMIRDIGVPSMVLMERAALCIADEAMKAPVFSVRRKEDIRVLSVCGSGNNGGDGAAAARILTLRGIHTDLYLLGNPEHRTPEMKMQLETDSRLCIRTVRKPVWKNYDILIDALFGIGLNGSPKGESAAAVGQMAESGAFVISADIPSGISADDGAVLGCAVRADVTVTMQFMKRGLLLYPGAEYAGKIVTADIGIMPVPRKGDMLAPDAEDLKILSRRNPAGNKATFGKVLVVAGRRNMAGAAFFAAMAAMRTGAGMVKVLTAEENRKIIQTKIPEAMLETYGNTPAPENCAEALAGLKKSLRWADAVACGPGIGTDAIAKAMTEEILKSSSLPLVLDADALNCLEGDLSLLKKYRGKCIVTPHPGEMSRLIGESTQDVIRDRLATALSFAKQTKTCCVLKDARTFTAGPDGTVYLNTTGNDGMATAGSGDVLTGITAAVLARGTEFVRAAALAVCLHGRAGDIAAEKKGKPGLMASDIIDGIRTAIPEGSRK